MHGVTREGPRSVLMVLYFFPPAGGVSMSRSVRNVQYLPQHGWLPAVLTPRRAGYHLQDPTSVKLIPQGTRVIRTRSLEAGHVRPVVIRLLRFLRARKHRRADFGNNRHPSEQGASNVPPIEGAYRPRGMMERIRQFVFFPDDQIGWLPFAVLAALRAHRSTPFDAIYSTSSPITAHLVAAIVKRCTGIPWIAEFRDPWLGNVLAAPLPWFHRRLQGKLERWIVGSADRVVGVSKGITNLYRTRYPEAADMVTITSGYDRSETRRPSRVKGSSERFRIIYTGTLDRPAELGIFLEGLERLVSRRPELRDRLEVAFYGTVSNTCAAVAERFRGGALDGTVRFHGFVPRRDALEALAGADAALILLGSGPGMGLFIGGKLFDYIGQDVQILAMIPPGDSRDILAELEWGIVSDPNPSDVATAIEKLLTLPPPNRRADPAGTYDREFVAGKLARSLDEVTGSLRGSDAVDR